MLDSPSSRNSGIPKKLTTKDFDSRVTTIHELTREFLEVSDTSLEVRNYLVDSTIPTVVTALDNLLREVERRGLLEGDKKAGGDRPKFDAINWLGINNLIYSS
jgi:type IV secretory pathway ATPase VirB11/archaellum biosynthesis ATPase